MIISDLVYGFFRNDLTAETAESAEEEKRERRMKHGNICKR
jgi:hypothetical protein